MPNDRVFSMSFAGVYPHYVAKAEKKEAAADAKAEKKDAKAEAKK